MKNRHEAFDSVELNAELWEKAYSVAFMLRRKGLTVPYTDVLIAACALETKAVLVHADVHFELIADHIGLKVESCLHLAKATG